MKKYGLERGIKGSDARHITLTEFYRNQAIESQNLQTNIGMLLAVEDAKRQSIEELKRQEQEAKLKSEQAKEQKRQKESELKKTEENLSQAKGQLKAEDFKNKVADVGSNIMDGIGSLVGTSKVKRQQQEIENLKEENAGLQTEVKTLKEQIQTNEREYTKVTEKLRQELDKIYALFPKIKELLRMENLCRHLGFDESLTKAILEMKPVGFRGKLYSSEYRRHFETDHSVAEIKPSANEPDRLRLTIDGIGDTNWFRQKYKEFQESIEIKVRQEPEMGKNKGIKM
jgi:FtsZ-binding cell division protein ZapB